MHQHLAESLIILEDLSGQTLPDQRQVPRYAWRRNISGKVNDQNTLTNLFLISKIIRQTTDEVHLQSNCSHLSSPTGMRCKIWGFFVWSCSTKELSYIITSDQPPTGLCSSKKGFFFSRKLVLQQYLEQLMLVALAVSFGPVTGRILE